MSHAVRVGRPPIELVLEQRGDSVHIEVADGGATHGRRPPQDWSQIIIDTLASRWGVRGDDAHAWFEVPVR